jgi:hypothetical protein
MRADGTGSGGFAVGSWVAKELAAAALRHIAERDVLTNVALAVEQKHLGQLGAANKGDDYGGGGLTLSVLGGDKPSRCLGQLRGWVEHLELFAGIFRGCVVGNPIHNVSGPMFADVGRYGERGQGIAEDSEERLVVAATAMGAGGEHEGIRSSEICGVDWQDDDIRVGHQGSIDIAEAGVSCFPSIEKLQVLRKLDNDAAFDGRVGLLRPLDPPRDNGVPLGISCLGGGCGCRLCGGRLLGGGCGRSRLLGGGCGGRLRGGGGGGGRVTLSERGPSQLLRNSSDLFRQSSEVLRLGGRGNNGALKKVIDLLGQSGNSLDQLGVGGNRGRAFKQGGGFNEAMEQFIYGINSDEVFPHCALDLVEAAGDGGFILKRGGLNGQGRMSTRSRRVWRARGLLVRPFCTGLLGLRIRSRGCGVFSILLEDGGEAIDVRHRKA